MITLGSHVKDSITGFTGIATNRVRHLHGCVHIGITPSTLKDGKPVESHGFDEQRIEVIHREEEPGGDVLYPLGSKVIDSLTGFEGIATGHLKYLFGGPLVAITPTALHDGRPVEPQWFDQDRVKIFEQQSPAVSPQSSARTGGPASPLSNVHR